MKHKVGQTDMQSGPRKEDLDCITRGHCGSNGLQRQEWLRKAGVERSDVRERQPLRLEWQWQDGEKLAGLSSI